MEELSNLSLLDAQLFSGQIPAKMFLSDFFNSPEDGRASTILDTRVISLHVMNALGIRTYVQKLVIQFLYFCISFVCKHHVLTKPHTKRGRYIFSYLSLTPPQIPQCYH